MKTNRNEWLCANKRKVVATYEGKRYADWHYTDVPPACVVLTTDNCLINLSRYK